MSKKLTLYNTLTRKKEIFKPLTENLVKMYVCGPTVYDDPHLGNARSVVIYDILYRILIILFGKESVKYVRNITDVDDKIINRANELNIKPSELTEKITSNFHHAMSYLGCLKPNIEPKATEHIDDMIFLIQKLIDNNYAYISNNHVYFDVTKSADYYKLSGRNANELIEAVRIEKQNDKRNPGDFVLWKPSAASEGLNYESPWGCGRPGWHIECSAMSHKYLSANFDIHGGGADLIFPHHTNEIAQSTAAFPQSIFAKYWIHNGFLTNNGEKMSKSLGNFITVKNLIDKQIPGCVSKLLLLSTHYRKPLDYNEKSLLDANKMITYWQRGLEQIIPSQTYEVEPPNDFLAALLEDINTPAAIKIINDHAKILYKSKNQEEKNMHASYIISCTKFLGLNLEQNINQQHLQSHTIEKLITKRQAAKLDKNWKEADKIRAELLKSGIIIEDKADGSTIWRTVQNFTTD